MKTTIVKLIDDLTGDEAAETIHFSLDGKEYEIDLSAANAVGMRESLKEFTTNARPLARPRTVRAATNRPLSPNTPQSYAGLTPYEAAAKKQRAEIRAWAAEHGIPVYQRGAISQRIIDMYNNRKDFEATLDAADRARAGQNDQGQQGPDEKPATTGENVGVSVSAQRRATRGGNGPTGRMVRKATTIPRVIFAQGELPVSPNGHTGNGGRG